MQKYISFDKVIDLFDKTASEGYTYATLDEGVLGYGHIVMLSPDDNHWNFELQEHYLNPWSSTHTIRRFRKISKALQEQIDEAEERARIQEKMEEIKHEHEKIQEAV